MRRHEKLLKTVLFLGDILAINLSLILVLIIKGRGSYSSFNSFLKEFLAIYIFWILIIFILNLYSLDFFKKPIDFLFNIIVFSFIALFFGVAYFYFRPQFGITPKTILVLNVLAFDALFFMWRYFFNSILELRGIKEKIVIIGLRPELDEVLSQINKSYGIVGLFGSSSTNSAFKNISSMLELKEIIKNKKVNSVLLASTDKNLVAEIFDNLPLRINYIYFNDLYEEITKKVSLNQLDEAWFLQKISKPENKSEQLAKRLFDFALSLAGLMLFLFFLLPISALIKLEDKGSVFYNQERVGKNGKIFLMRKFRTMKESKNQYKEVWRETNESNITAVGKVLRKIHFDELPQAWNIFKGELSFVGPRAEWSRLAEIFEKEIPFYKQRYLVKPGLFGWAQINYPASKSVNEAKEKFEYDLYYIKNHSFLLDLEILLKSIKLFVR